MILPPPAPGCGRHQGGGGGPGKLPEEGRDTEPHLQGGPLYHWRHVGLHWRQVR